jgi:DNA mismatch endonuclease, patch repair protein
MDVVSAEQRSTLMAGIRNRDTGPELTVRRVAHRLGYRFRTHRRDLPGTPDIVFPGRRKVVFVHGCFWHRHAGCRLAYEPKSNVEFWQAKFRVNVARDERVAAALQVLGWTSLTIWECEVRDVVGLARTLEGHLSRVD